MNNSNTWLTGSEQSDFYLNSRDIILVERERCLKLLVDLFEYNFPEKENLSILDLGCGDGIISKILSQRYPNNTFYLLDGSNVMLEKVSKSIRREQFSFHSPNI